MRLLVVEDDPDLAAALRSGLVGEGYTVDIADDGEAGLRLAATGAYGVVILDLMLPRLSGYEVCRRLRAAGDATPVLVLTAKDGEYDQADALDLGADDVVTKPFSFPLLLARIRALSRRQREVEGSLRLEVGDLHLDLRRRECLRGDVLVSLTPLEFALVEALAERPSEVLSKAELLLTAWGGEVDDPNLVEARISALRRKIDLPFARRSLQTVRGAGYRLVDDRDPGHRS